jgi:hypothetical protein
MEDKDSEEGSEDDGSDGTDHHCKKGWEPPCASDFVLRDDEPEDEDEVGEEFAELSANMHTLFMLQSARGRSETCDFFQNDPEALGRAHKELADLVATIRKVEREQEEIFAKTSVIEHQIQETQTRLDESVAKIEALDATYQRKRQTGDAALDHLNLMTGPGSRPHAEHNTTPMDLVELVGRTANISVQDGLSRLPHVKDKLHEQFVGTKIPAPTASPEHLAKWIQAQKCSVKGVPACSPHWIVDLRDARGHQAMLTLVPSASRRRSNATRSWRAKCFYAVLRVLIIPGKYAAIIQRNSFVVAPVALSQVDFGSKEVRLEDDTVVRYLVDKGLTVAIADDSWQFCRKYAEAEIASIHSSYDKETLRELLDLARDAVTDIGEPSGIRLPSEDQFPRGD